MGTDNRYPKKPRSPNVRSYMTEIGLKDWSRAVMRILESNVPDWNEQAWRDWKAAHPWIVDRDSQEIKILERLHYWVKFDVHQYVKNERTLMVASLLVNRDLVRPEAQQSRALPDMRGFFLIDENSAHFRCHALRDLLKCDFIRRPYALAYAWENVVERKNGVTDWNALEKELHARAIILEENGLSARCNPFLSMAAEPHRSDFVRRLERYLRKHPPNGAQHTP